MSQAATHRCVERLSERSPGAAPVADAQLHRDLTTPFIEGGGHQQIEIAAEFLLPLRHGKGDAGKGVPPLAQGKAQVIPANHLKLLRPGIANQE